MPADEKRLVRQTLDGSHDAFRELVTRYQRPVFSIVVRMVRDRSDAEDLAQEVFVKVYRALGSYDPKRKLSSWIFKIAHNAAIDHLRRQGLATVPLEGEGEEPGPADFVADAGAETPEAAAERGDLARAFEAGLGRLRPEYREVLVLRFQEGLAYEEIAEVTGLPLGTVKTHLHRARKALAKQLEAAGFERPGGRR